MAELVHQGPFASSSEERTARHLAEKLPDKWLIVCNKLFVSPRGEQFEVDYIIMGRHHIFVADEKNISGQVRSNENDWTLSSGQLRRNPLNKLHLIAGRLAGYIRDRFPQLHTELAGHFVEAVVIMSAPDARVTPNDPRVPRQVLSIENAAAKLQEYDSEAKASGSSISQWRHDIIECLHLLSTPPPTPETIGAYSIVEKVDVRPYSTTYLAQIQRGAATEERILKVYDLTALRIQERDRQVQVMQRGFQAILRLEGKVLVPEVHEPFPFDDRFWVVPYAQWDLQPLGALLSTAPPPDFQRRLAIVQHLFEAVTRLHEAGVVHRNLSPHTVCIRTHDNGDVDVGLTGFEFARIQAEQTMAGDLTGLYEAATAYEAPEVLADLSLASEATDFYSAAIIALELLTEKSAAQLLSECKSAPDCVISEAVAAQEHNLEGLLDALVLLIISEPAGRMELVDDILRMLHEVAATSERPSDGQTEDGPEELTVYAKGDIIDKQYRVDHVFKPGATAVAYIVTDQHYGGQYVLKQIFHEERLRRLAGTEFTALKDLQHDAIVRLYDVRGPDSEFHLKLEYVPGSSLEELAGEFPWPADRTHEVARNLLDALAYLAEKDIYHRDISPRNIVVSDVGAKLIDFGVAHVDADAGITTVGTPRYRAPEIDGGGEWDASCDVYAASVVLFRALTGEYPFRITETSSDKSALVDLAHLGLDEVTEQYACELQKGCHPDREQRYSSARDLLEALERVIARPPAEAEGDWVENEIVMDLQAIYKNSRSGNADNRGLDTRFAQDTYVDTLLDTSLIPEIAGGNFLLVLLTGNPGDGKTAFLEHVRRHLEQAGAEFASQDDNGWEASANGRVFSANYDASESHRGERADAILDRMLQPLAGSSPPPRDLQFTSLLAINDGRLRDYFLHNDRYRWLGSVIGQKLLRLDADDEPRVALVDLKSRCLTSGSDEGSALFERVLSAIVHHEGWSKCDACKAREECIIRFNRDSLADAAHGATTRARLADLFHLTHLRGARHTTIRDLRSALSYIIAGIRSCKEIHEEIRSGKRVDDWHHALYFNAVFNPADELDDELDDLKQYDVGGYPAPRWGRFLHYNRSHDKQSKINEMLLSGFQRSQRPLAGVSFAAQQAGWYPMMQRRLYFEMDAESVQAHDERRPLPEKLLPYTHARSFEEVVAGKADLHSVREWLCEAISASDGIMSPDVREGHLCVRTAYNDAQELTVFKRHPVEYFTCKIILPADGRFIESCPNTVEFAHVSGDPRLRIHLDLFELLMRMRAGYVPEVLEWEPYLVDLQQFKTRLQRLQSDEVILMESGRVLHRVYQQDGRLIREAVTARSDDR